MIYFLISFHNIQWDDSRKLEISFNIFLKGYLISQQNSPYSGLLCILFVLYFTLINRYLDVHFIEKTSLIYRNILCHIMVYYIWPIRYWWYVSICPKNKVIYILIPDVWQHQNSNKVENCFVAHVVWCAA